jgi:hypothetical protein
MILAKFYTGLNVGEIDLFGLSLTSTNVYVEVLLNQGLVISEKPGIEG